MMYGIVPVGKTGGQAHVPDSCAVEWQVIAAETVAGCGFFEGGTEPAGCKLWFVS
jgi:hypothetical protein